MPIDSSLNFITISHHLRLITGKADASILLKLNPSPRFSLFNHDSAIVHVCAIPLIGYTLSITIASRNEQYEMRKVQNQLKDCAKFKSSFMMSPVNNEEKTFPLAFRLCIILIKHITSTALIEHRLSDDKLHAVTKSHLLKRSRTRWYYQTYSDHTQVKSVNIQIPSPSSFALWRHQIFRLF